MTGPQFVIDYKWAGRFYSVTIPAADWQDAESHLLAIKHTGQIVGEHVSTVPANSVTLPFAWAWARVSTWWRNL